MNAIENPDKLERSMLASNQFLIRKLYFNEKFQKEHLLLIITEIDPAIIKVITVIDTSKISKYF